MRTTALPSHLGRRLIRALWRQEATMRRVGTHECPPTDLRGRVALVTGGNSGIGLEASRGLARRGARLIIGARNAQTREQACRSIRAEVPDAQIEHTALDLADLASVQSFAEQVSDWLADATVDIFLQNAGYWPQRYSRSPQGYEIAFATNVLGHFALTQHLLPHLLPPGRGPGARVVVVTGDIYYEAEDCTPHFVWQGAKQGQVAYSRSKLGNHWFAAQLQRRQSRLQVCSVHPGVVASGLVTAGPAMAWLQDRLLINTHRGAQTPLHCCVAESVAPAGYYHNTCGRAILAATDKALDLHRARRMWHDCETALAR